MRARISMAMAMAGLAMMAVTLTSAGNPVMTERADSERVFVKVYSLADLVAPLHEKQGVSHRSTLANWASELQSDTQEHLARLKEVVRLALPDESWKNVGGQESIVCYVEKLSLVIRQTATGHRAIEDLLKQLRVSDDFEIELTVEQVGFDRLSDEQGLELMPKFGKSLAPEELADLRKRLPIVALAEVRIANGRTVVGAGVLNGLHLRFTALAAPDRQSVELRLDNISDDIQADGTFLWNTQIQTIATGTTVARLTTCDGGAIGYLITPRIVHK